jgi:hypothetical protein
MREDRQDTRGQREWPAEGISSLNLFSFLVSYSVAIVLSITM